MLSLSDKIHIRANTLWLLYSMVKPSTIIVVYVLLLWAKFYHYGLAMYEGRAFPKMTHVQAVQTFTDLSVLPYGWWFVGAVIVERFVLSPFYFKFVVCRIGK